MNINDRIAMRIHRRIEGNTGRRVGDIFIIEGLRLRVRGESASTNATESAAMPIREDPLRAIVERHGKQKKKEDYYANATSALAFSHVSVCRFHAVSQLRLTQRFAHRCPSIGGIVDT